jgi:hypothetical protein
MEVDVSSQGTMSKKKPKRRTLFILLSDAVLAILSSGLLIGAILYPNAFERLRTVDEFTLRMYIGVFLLLTVVSLLRFFFDSKLVQNEHNKTADDKAIAERERAIQLREATLLQRLCVFSRFFFILDAVLALIVNFNSYDASDAAGIVLLGMLLATAYSFGAYTQGERVKELQEELTIASEHRAPE